MKKLSNLLIALAVIFCALNTAVAQSTVKNDRAEKAGEIKKLVSNKDFVFEATNSRQPLGYHQYDVAIAKDTLVANLPGSDSPLKIATTDFAYNSTAGKNGSWDIVIRPKAGVNSNVKQLRLNVTPQGHAMLHVTTRRHGPLSLNGYIKQEDY